MGSPQLLSERPDTENVSDNNAPSQLNWLRWGLGILGVVLIVASGAIFLSLPDQTVGDVEAIESSLEPGPLPTNPPVLSLPELASTAPEEEIDEGEELAIAPNNVSRLDELGSASAAVPVGLVIGAIEVDAPVVPYGVNERTGQMDVPRNTRDVAWYEYGPSPGQDGSAVLAAHVDRASEGPGVFFDLKTLEPGDRVGVEYDDGSTEWFEVEARVTYEKEDLPLETIFSREGAPVLTLITCGGGFSDSVQSYDSNVVVYATPVDGSSLGSAAA